jgi:hypothetical protein
MQLDQILAFTPQMLRSKDFTVARRQRAATAWNVETVELRKSELRVQE